MPHGDNYYFDAWQRRNDADAFAELVSRHSGMVYGTAKRVLRSSSDAEDVTQESFLRLAQHEKFIESIPGWLHQVALRLSLSRLRGDKRRHQREEKYQEEMPSSASPAAEWDGLLPVVDEAIANLPEKNRVAVVLRFLEGKTHAAIAEELGISRSGAQKRIEMGLREIRNFLKTKGVASSSSLAVLLSTNITVEAAPPAVTAALGKHILASMGTSPIQSTSSLILKGAMVMSGKKSLITLGAVIITLLLVSWVINISVNNDTSNAPAVAENGKTASITVTEEFAAKAGDLLGQSETSDMDALASSPETNISGGDRGEEATDDLAPSSIAGVVLNKDSYPIADASVRLEVFDPPHRVVKRFKTTSNKDGEYTFSDLNLVPEGWRPNGDFGMLFVAAKEHVMESREIWHLQPGESREDVDIVLPKASNYVKGVVVTQEGDAVPQAQVSLIMLHESGALRGREMQWLYSMADDRGRFEISIPGADPVLCTFSVVKEGYAEGRFFNVETGTDDARFGLPAQGTITGRVTLEDGSPSVGTVVAVTSERGNHSSQELNRFNPLRGTDQMGITDADGNYAVENLSPHVNYNLGVFDKPEPEVRSEWWDWMVFGNREELRMQAEAKNLHVDAGEVLSGVDFELKDEYYFRISGRMLEQETMKPDPKNALAFQMRTNDGRIERNMYWTGEEGRYQGEVLLSEKAEIFGFRGFHVSDLGMYPAKSIVNAKDGQPVQSLVVSPGDEITIDFLVPGHVTIPVRVVDNTGTPVPGVGVGVGPVHENGQWEYKSIHITKVDENGQCQIIGVPPEFACFVWVQQAPDSTLLDSNPVPISQYGPIQGESGETVEEVVLVVDVKGGIEGVFVDAAGNPILNASIVVSAPGLEEDTLQTTRVRSDDTDGHITIVNALLPAHYPEIYFTTTVNGETLEGNYENVEVVAESIVDLGKVTLTPVLQDQPN